jgi:hypothetical protein
MSSEPLNEKISFRITKSQAERLAERAHADESPSKTAVRVLTNALLQSSLAEVLATLPQLVDSTKALIEDVPGRLAEAMLEQISEKSASLINQKMADLTAAQAARDEANRRLMGKILEKLEAVEGQNRTLAQGVRSVVEAIS